MTEDTNTSAEAGTGDTSEGAAVSAFERIIAAENAPAKADAKADTAEKTDEDEEDKDGETGENADTSQDETDVSDEDAEEEPKEPEEPVKVKLPDGTEATLEELTKGYLRQSDYTRKTQEASAERKEIASQRAELAEVNRALLSKVGTAEAILRRTMPPEPNPQLEDSDPLEYAKQERYYRRRLSELQAVVYERNAAEARVQQETADASKEYLAGETARLVEVMPEFKDAGKAREFKTRALDIGTKDYGFTADEIEGIADHRYILVLRDALKYRELQKAKPKVEQKIEGKPPVQKPGKRATPAQVEAKGFAERIERLRQSGSTDAAASVFYEILKKG